MPLPAACGPESPRQHSTGLQAGLGPVPGAHCQARLAHRCPLPLAVCPSHSFAGDHIRSWSPMHMGGVFIAKESPCSWWRHFPSPMGLCPGPTPPHCSQGGRLPPPRCLPASAPLRLSVRLAPGHRSGALRFWLPLLCSVFFEVGELPLNEFSSSSPAEAKGRTPSLALTPEGSALGTFV